MTVKIRDIPSLYYNAIRSSLLYRRCRSLRATSPEQLERACLWPTPGQLPQPVQAWTSEPEPELEPAAAGMEPEQ